MPFVSQFSEEFLNEFKKLDKSVKDVAEKHLRKIIEAPLAGKNLHGEANLFSERFLHHRIVYKVEGQKILFLKLGKRDEVYRRS